MLIGTSTSKCVAITVSIEVRIYSLAFFCDNL
jgi:hypothetical protein